MRNLSNTSGSIGNRQDAGKSGDFGETFETDFSSQDLINKANSVPLTIIFKYYGININPVNYMSICPFLSHKGGRESTPSFKYFDQTNSFYCYGCKVGHGHAHACLFVSLKEDITYFQAAQKILNLFGENGNIIPNNYEPLNYKERLELIIESSNYIRNFRLNFPDAKSLLFIEENCMLYDKYFFSHKNLSVEALRRMIEILKDKFIKYEMSFV